jgi:tetratricopeptide (TPR) repeat protein
MAGRRVDRRAFSVLAVILSLLVVALATIAVASTLVAIRAKEANKKATSDLEQAERALDGLVVAAATREELKGFKMNAARDELIKPAAAYYEAYVAAHKDDVPPRPDVAEAYLRLAGLQAKLGSTKSVASLNGGITYIDKLIEAGVDPETYPSVEECAMKVAAPNEWLMVKGATFNALPKHAAQLFFAISGAIMTFEDAHKKFPEAVKPRDELARVLAYSAQFQVRQRRYEEGLSQWSQARDMLETLVKDRPANVDYQRRLLDALIGTAQLQKRLQKTEEARATYERAIQVAEKLAAAQPDDKGIAAQLETAKKDLASLPASAPAAEVAASPESPAADGEPKEAKAEDAPPAEGDSAAAGEKKDAAPDAKQPDAKQAEASPVTEPKADDAQPAGEASDPSADTAGEKSAEGPPAEQPPATP